MVRSHGVRGNVKDEDAGCDYDTAESGVRAAYLQTM